MTNLINAINANNERTEEDIISELVDFANNMPGIVFWKNKEGVYLWHNNFKEQNRLQYQWPVSNIIGRTDYDLFPSYIADKYRLHDLEAMLSDNGNVYEDVGRLANEKEYTILSYKKPLKEKTGEIIGIIGNIIDITDLKQLERLSPNYHEKSYQEILKEVQLDINEPLKEILLLINLIESNNDSDNNLNLLSEIKNFITILFENCNDITTNNLENTNFL